MRCEDVRQALWPQPGPRPVSAGLTEAFEHYSACADCQAFFRVQEALGRRLGRLAEVRAPLGLDQRIQESLAEHESDLTVRRRTRWLAGTGTVLVAAAAAITLMLARPSVPAEVAQPLVAEARIGLEVTDAIASSNPGEVSSWLESQVGYEVTVPDITDALLLGGRVAELGGSKSAAIVYLFHGMPVSYFALPTNDVMGKPIRSEKVIPITSDGYEVALWSEQGSARAVVAPMPREEVVQLAEECRRKAMSVS